MNSILFIALTIFSIFILVIIIRMLLYIINFYFPLFSDIKTECIYRRWGCCNDNLTPKLDQDGTNCI